MSNRELQKKRLALNSVTAISYQLCAVSCGFVLPRLILQYYGSNINGLLLSITHFLSIIAFMEMGVGAVIQSSLYKPLAECDKKSLSIVVSAGDAFFRKIARILLAYIVVLVFVYPLFISDYDWLTTVVLIVAISLSSFAQYYWGLMNGIILVSNQQGYILYFSQIITVIANTIISVVLIKNGFSIQMVKIVASVIFILRPLMLYVYVSRHFSIDRRIKYNDDPIKQKWDGVSQHIAHIVLENVDVLILTFFSTFSNISIYSIYHMIIYGIKNLFLSISHGFQSLLGEFWAKKEERKISDFFSFTEYFMHSCVVFLFSCMAALILPFVRVYTDGIHDADYCQPVFALLLILAHAIHCLKTPYHIIVKVAGEYKKTSSCFFSSALTNVFVSLVLVPFYGLIGVAIGTLVAMTLQTIWLIIYDVNHLLKFQINKTIELFLTDAFSFILIFKLSSLLSLEIDSFVSWLVLAVKVGIIAVFVVGFVSLLFYRKEFFYGLSNLKKKNEA